MSQRPGRAQLSLPIGEEPDKAPCETITANPGVSRDVRPDPDRLLLTVPEVARSLHIGRRQAWEMVWRGELPVVRLGRSVRVARPVLERFVTERSAPYGA